MSGYAEVFRRGRGRHRRRRRIPLKTVAVLSALVTCSAFAVTRMEDDPLDCAPRRGADGRPARLPVECRGAGAALRAGAPAGKAPGRAGGEGGDGVPHDGDGGRPGRASAPPEAEGGYDRERCGNTSGRLLLSLDDWAYSDPERSVRIGAQLQAQGVRAAFFLIGKFAAQYPNITATLRQQGHWVGNHSFTHKQLTALDDQELHDEIRSGVNGNLLRPPYGDAGERERDVAADLGYRICNWTIDTHDWEKGDGPGGLRSAEAVRASVRDASQEEKRNGVILGHLFSNFPAALNDIIADLHAQGYQLCRNTGPVTENVPHPLPC
ncbi:polysaccharide deacetylase family protein [Streptomyces sp. NPDC049585]|uniref:polysaccharide deacetylase family protein n=1 Tax=Streptomyces sp. NPDC049585 TaxID=3155154 RepID=UPI0034186547